MFDWLRNKPEPEYDGPLFRIVKRGTYPEYTIHKYNKRSKVWDEYYEYVRCERQRPSRGWLDNHYQKFFYFPTFQEVNKKFEEILEAEKKANTPWHTIREA